MANIDSFGSTLLDGRRASLLKDFAGSIKGEQVHLGRTQATSQNYPRSVPLISGSNLVFAADTQDANLVKWVRVAINTITSGNNIALSSGVAIAEYTATSNSTVAAASGLAAACASQPHQHFLNFAWSIDGANVYGVALNTSVSTAFSLAFADDVVLYQRLSGGSALARVTMSNDLAGVSVIGLPWLTGLEYFQNNHTYNASSLELLGNGRHISLTETAATVRRLDGPLTGAIDVFDLGASWLYIDQQNLLLQVNKNGTAEVELTYDGFGGIYSACTDGTYYYLIGYITTDALAILQVDTNYDVVSCFTYADELATQVLPSYGGDIEGPIAQVVDDTIVLHCTRGGVNPIWVGIQASDLATVKWCKTSRKQELSTTIGVNDPATTYSINISGQIVSVAGNAGGANATATALKDACVASVLSEFTQSRGLPAPTSFSVPGISPEP